MWRIATVVAVIGLFTHVCAHAAGEAAIRSFLTKSKSWTMYSEYTDSPTPTDRAQKLKFEYFERDEKLKGRWLLEFGGCEFEVALRGDGFSHSWCPPYQGGPSLDFDPSDSQYPFKSANPRKLWLKADD